MPLNFLHLPVPPLRPPLRRWWQFSGQNKPILTCHNHNPRSRNSLSQTLILSSRPMITLVNDNLSRRCVKVRSGLNFPLISPSDQWGNWAALFSIGAIGSWSETTQMRNVISGTLVSILLGLIASNLGIVSGDAQAYSVVLEYLLPLAVPLLLFRADMFRVLDQPGSCFWLS